MRQKSYIPQHFSPFVFAFHFIVKKDMEWTLLLEKKKKKNLKEKLTSYPFSLLLFLLSSSVGTGDVTQRPAAKSSSAQLSLRKYKA